MSLIIGSILKVIEGSPTFQSSICHNKSKHWDNTCNTWSINVR